MSALYSTLVLVVFRLLGRLCSSVVRRGSWRRGPNPISQEIVLFKSQLKSHNPSMCCSNWNPIPIFLFFFHESQSQCTKSHFPASKKGKSQLPFYPFTTLFVRLVRDHVKKYASTLITAESSVRAPRITLVLQQVFQLLGRFVYRLFVRLVRDHVSTCRILLAIDWGDFRLKGSPLVRLSLGYWVTLVRVVYWAQKLVL